MERRKRKGGVRLTMRKGETKTLPDGTEIEIEHVSGTAKVRIRIDKGKRVRVDRSLESGENGG